MEQRVRTFVTRVRGKYWYLRVPVKGKIVHHQTFSDKTHGSKAQALTVTLDVRDAWVDKLGIDLTKADQGYMAKPAHRYTHTKVSERNTTGVVGVMFYYKLQEGKRYPVYVAVTRPNGKTKYKTFSCNRYGDDGAFLLAVNYRAKWELKLKEEKNKTNSRKVK